LSGISKTAQMTVLTVAVMAVTFSRTALGPLQETMRLALSLTDNQIAVLQGPALGLPVVMAAIPLMFALVNLSGSVLTAIASSFTVFFVARCLVGLTATATLAAAVSLMADYYAPAERGRAAMAMAFGQIGGMAASFALGGWMLSILDDGPNRWRWAMAWLTGFLLILIAPIPAMREPVRMGTHTEKPAARQAITELWHFRAQVAPLLAGVVLFAIAEQAVLIWAAPMLARQYALLPGSIGAIMAIGVLVSGVLGAASGGLLADLCQRTGGPRRTMSLLGVLALLNIPAALFSMMPTVALAGVLLVVFLTIGHAIGVTVTPLATVIVPNELRGLFMAVLFAVGAIFGLGVAPVAVSVLSGAMGGPSMVGRALAVIGISASVLGGTTFAIGRRAFPRETP
jgi:predicted MFS family arabinose efflux permease